MNLLEGFLKDGLYIDFGAEIQYGSDQMNMSYPVRFATVGFQLMATGLLDCIADRIRVDKKMNLLPMHPVDEFTEEMCDQDGWYDYYISLNEISKSKVDSCIEVIVISDQAKDNEERYTIDLNEMEQALVYARLDEQCREYLGKSCEELLAEAREEMEAEE